MGFPGGSMVKNLPAKLKMWILSRGRSPGGGNGDRGEGNDNPLQHSCLGNPKDRGGWQVLVPQRIARTEQLNKLICMFHSNI